MWKPWLRFLVVGIAVVGCSSLVRAQDSPEALDITISPEGVGVVQAILLLPVPPERVHAILLDYPNWPRLFPHHPTVHKITKIKDRVRVSMSLPGFFLPVTLQLVTETHEPHPFRIVTQLVEGDFERYDWVWELSSREGDTHTLATLTLNVKPRMWIPGWLLHWLLKSELEEHFDTLRAEVQKTPPRLPQTPIQDGSS